jgi:hypothetical protein
MTNLSPHARAVLDAFVGDPTERDELEDDRRYLAAALRAAAEHVVRDRVAQMELRLVADELEGNND